MPGRFARFDFTDDNSDRHPGGLHFIPDGRADNDFKGTDVQRLIPGVISKFHHMRLDVRVVCGERLHALRRHALLPDPLLDVFYNFLLQLLFALMVRTVVVFIKLFAQVKTKYIEHVVKPC